MTALSVDHKAIDAQGQSEYYWKCLCECGKHIVVLSSVLSRGDTQSCGCLQAEESARRAKSRIIDITGQRFGALTVVRRIEVDSTDYGKGLWECKCDCGNNKQVEGYYLRKGMITSCGCLKQSKYELYVSRFLDAHGLSAPEHFVLQKRFNDLHGLGYGLLSYDFALYDKGKLYLLIECQGKQHYEPVEMFGGIEQFKKQQEHDRLKREFARKLGVTLLEIPYSEDTYEKIAKLLSNYIIVSRDEFSDNTPHSLL